MRDVIDYLRRTAAGVVTALLVCALRLEGATLDEVGVTLLRATTSGLNGAGVAVAQPEAGAPNWQASPGGTGFPAARFSYRSSGGTSGEFPNTLGAESDHANAVGGAFYGLNGGVATNVSQVENFEASYFLSGIVIPRVQISARVVNQSFVLGGGNTASVDQSYDWYAARYNTLFVSAAGNGGTVSSPSTAYNGISVGASGGGSSTGPTGDNGRAKPDLTAPASLTSFSTPLVAGAAALLIQAGLRGDGGGATEAAADIRTVKALLLNGALKPADWNRPAGSPLDARYGAGVLHVFNSYRQLAGGKQGFQATGTIATGGDRTPPGNGGNVSALSGWDFGTLTSGITTDALNNYYVHVTNAAGAAAFTGTVTLTWLRQLNQSSINDLDLYLYDAATGAVVASSTSSVDNVEHIYVPNLPAGRYVLQVLKHGGLTKRITNGESYALAFEFFSVAMGMERSGGTSTLTWPVYPAGFRLESTPSLTPPVTWSAAGGTPVISNDQNRQAVDSSGGVKFYRLKRP